MVAHRNQINKRNQIDQTNQINKRDQINLSRLSRSESVRDEMGTCPVECENYSMGAYFTGTR